MKVGSLFSGIGGLDLGLERAGMTVAWQSEIDPYACRVLAKHWPHVPNLGDITTIDWSTVEPVDLVCGGYPCQPFSLAGTRAGENDARHLWPHFANALRLLRPRIALLENVPGHLSLGFGRVLGDLAELGFDAEWDCIPAAAVGAPHLRYRVFVVAHTKGFSGSNRTRLASRQALVGAVSGADGGSVNGHSPSRGSVVRPSTTECQADVADTDGQSTRRLAEPRGQCDQWATEPDVGRVAHGVPARVDRLRCLGNAVVPQVAEYVGRRIMAAAA